MTATQWPDFTADNVAFAAAKAELPGASLSEIAQRAQSIKRSMSRDLIIDKPKRKG